ncbi:MAG TPA: zinc ribbon domain-containing protein [Thermoanaerobaculia bacterium]|nr:zinc ribbon domain-containing protein [Thermoanaerobaculia bacterium]
MSELLENALDSLRMGVRHFLEKKLETADKWAILELFHTIELLLKERLYREHPIFIYKNIDQAIGDDSYTVGLREILARFTNLEIDIPKDYANILLDLQKRRNRIEHHRFVPDKTHHQVLGEALKFIKYFLEEHLEEELEGHLPPKHFEAVKSLILSYEELVRRAESDARSILDRFSPKEQAMIEIATCPQCGNESLVLGAGEDEDKCYFCDEQIETTRCWECGTPVNPDSLVGTICQNCFSYKMSRD